MGLMNKLRDMFTEEVDEVEEEPIKKEVIQVEIPAPQQKEEEVVEAPKKEEKVQQPIFFDDNDFANLEQPKKVEKNSGYMRKHISYDKPRKVEEKQEKKVFKPTPIISPVYGVLDKNYHKEDIKQKNNYSSSAYYNHKDVNIDDIRKKAYGTLEDDLEVTLFGEPDKVDVEPAADLDMFDELLENSNNKVNETVDDSDLFNLIDSMYEKEDDNSGNGK
ncbi:MAG: hypothetical protein ACI31V_02020 [Bacilli bacterium]